MANYDLDYEGSVVQDILDTGKSLEDDGYIFLGTATPSTIPGTPTERVAYVGGPGTYNNFGTTVVVPSGSIVVITYSGSAWSKTVINPSADGYVYAGIATAETNPGTPTGKVFYIATTVGTYTHFGNISVSNGINILKYNGTAWSKDVAIQIIDAPTENSEALVTAGGVYNALATILGKLAEGYIYAGIATAATNPGTPTGKVFYVATAAGTYTNFGGLVVTQGINILKYNGTAWSQEQLIGIDDVPTGSDNLVKSGGVKKFLDIEDHDISETRLKYYIWPYSSLDGYRVKLVDGSVTVEANQYMNLRKFNVEELKIYSFGMTAKVGYHFDALYWLDVNGDFIKAEIDVDSMEGAVTLDGIITRSPDGAAELWVNTVLEDKNNLYVQNVTEYIKEDVSLEAQTNVDISNLEELYPDSVDSGHFFSKYGYIRSNASFAINKYSVEEGGVYAFSGTNNQYINSWFVAWADINSNIILLEDYKGYSTTFVKKGVVAPKGAVYAFLNVYTSDDTRKFYKVASSIKSSDIENLLMRKIGSTMTPSSSDVGHYAKGNVGETALIGVLAQMNYAKYSVTPGSTYLFSGYFSSTVTTYAIIWVDVNDVILKKEVKGTSGQVDVWVDEELTAPAGSASVYMNIESYYASYFSLKSVITELINVGTLEKEVIKNTEDIDNLMGTRLMKVVINAFESDADSVPFYIRTKYNESKDIILTHKINYNGLLTFKAAYVGSKALSDDALMSSTYLVSTHEDSTAPLFNVTTDCPYWHTYAQHGYPIPYIANNAGLDASDVGAEWKDQLNRHYIIGKITTELIYLLPVIYQSDGHNTRDWRSYQSAQGGNAITTLTYVTGGSTGHHTSQINVSGYAQIQLRPIMSHSDRKWVVDGKAISSPGTYYCNEFSVSESQIGYDPATITDWFGGADGNPDLTGADITAKFTFSYNYKGAQCAMNTTINILKEVICDSYGAIQQQFFYDNGDYKAMFMIPKAKARSGVDFEKPFNSPTSGSTGYDFYRTSDDLNDVNDLIDRQIGFLHNPNNNQYMIGMAAGLSLVSGDTVKEKRLPMIPVGSTNQHYRLNALSPANNNKFYIAAFNTAPYESNDYYLPVGFFKEINTYVSYFDPAENVGQVYWYKDGNSYVIYAHCQSVQSGLAIKVPDFMEGLNLTVVEKTSNTDLLTETIQNGKFFVNYNTADANYIVLKTN